MIRFSKRQVFSESSVSPLKEEEGRSSVIRQTGESQNGCSKKIKHLEFSGKETSICYPLIRTCARLSEGKKKVGKSIDYSKLV